MTTTWWVPCALCSNPHTVAGLCNGHPYYEDYGWAETNRLLCDFFHRRIEPPRIIPEERACVEDSS